MKQYQVRVSSKLQAASFFVRSYPQRWTFWRKRISCTENSVGFVFSDQYALIFTIDEESDNVYVDYAIDF